MLLKQCLRTGTHRAFGLCATGACNPAGVACWSHAVTQRAYHSLIAVGLSMTMAAGGYAPFDNVTNVTRAPAMTIPKCHSKVSTLTAAACILLAQRLCSCPAGWYFARLTPLQACAACGLWLRSRTCSRQPPRARTRPHGPAVLGSCLPVPGRRVAQRAGAAARTAPRSARRRPPCKPSGRPQVKLLRANAG